jgi:predicted DNA-binding transcriptional regulator YafY
MSDIQITEEKRMPCPELTGKALHDHANQLFQMYSGDKVEVKMRFHRSLLNVVVDRFGREVMLIPDGPEHFTFLARVVVSPMFLSWVIGFGHMAKILHPQAVAEQCRQMCLESLAQYDTAK